MAAPSGASETVLKAKAKAAGHRITVGEDKAYDSADHATKLRGLNVTPHVAQNDTITATGKRRRSAIDARTTRHEGYGMSQSRRAMRSIMPPATHLIVYPPNTDPHRKEQSLNFRVFRKLLGLRAAC